MKYIFPDYDKSLLSLVSSIENYFGIKNTRKTLPILDEALNEKEYKNIIVILFDGFGYNLLTKNKKDLPFLYNNLKDKISSVFPSTTTAATTSVLSGLAPIEHGFLGWDMYIDKLDEVVTLFLNRKKESKEPIENWNSFEDLKCKYVTEKISNIIGCKGTSVSPFGDIKYSDIDDMNKKIISITKNDKKNYIYAYYESPDDLMHDYGTKDKKVIDNIKMIDEKFKELCESLNDSLIIMIADHGHIDTDWITLSNYPKVFNMLKTTTWIDSRASMFMVKDEYKKVFKEEIKKVIGPDFILLSKEEILNKKIFGEGAKNKYFDGAIGDYIAIATGDKSIRYSDKHEMFKSNHSGITEEEVYVPLVIVKK